MSCKICGENSVNPWTGRDENVCSSCLRIKPQLMENSIVKNEGVCFTCGEKIKGEYLFCASCGARIARDRKDIEINIPKELRGDEYKSWYDTGWVWFWLLIFWPVGVYGLIKKVKIENQKWWWMGLAGIFFFVISSQYSDEASSNKSKNGPTVSEISACKDSIRYKTFYQPSDMDFIGMESGYIVIRYKGPRTGKEWDIRCKNDKVEFSVPGRSFWGPLN